MEDEKRVMNSLQFAKSLNGRMKEMQATTGIDQVHDPDNEFSKKSTFSQTKFSEMAGSQYRLEVRNGVEILLPIRRVVVIS